MFTVQLIGDRKDEFLRRRIVNVKFTSQEREFDHEFQFSLDVDVTTVKKTIKQFLDELNSPLTPLTGDITEVIVKPEPTPTQAEKDKATWHLKWKRLQAYKKLKDHGVNSLTPAQVTTLIAEVETGLQAGYGDII